MKLRFANQIGRMDESATRLKGIIVHTPALKGAKLQKFIKASPESAVFIGKLDGERVIFKLFNGEKASETVERQAAELSYLQGFMAEGPYQAMRMVQAFPDAGLSVLSFMPGNRLDAVMAKADAAKRRRLVAQCGSWLKRYTSGRQRLARFGPHHWVEKRADLPARIPDADDQALAARLHDNMHRRAPLVAGADVCQAATHGDFTTLNLTFHQGTLYGLDIQGESWMALTQEIARFLVYLQITHPHPSGRLRLGISEPDLKAFLKCGLLDPREEATTLPFFIASQLLGRFVQEYKREDTRANTRAAIEAFLKLPISPDALG
ncbi:hypothetical protein PSA7680_02540 [Pseudoruegeria aquimaris]|uniref:Aminoglycoside phosphotransferase domain-containing protein n=1 Tax=Pseudoruegeria aquimaris TaxID=393663 RepID=A0A1Y5SYE9_9RHOB|nr:phosphotransferase [Pseudoruegeria aquimaris]SLN49366.1 hypothetical protein PSA7680_02540 [Pseudoruegeria aquimaris]